MRCRRSTSRRGAAASTSHESTEGARGASAESDSRLLEMFHEGPSGSNVAHSSSTCTSQASSSSASTSSAPNAPAALFGSAPLFFPRYKPPRDETFCDCLMRGAEKECKCGEDDTCSSTILSRELEPCHIQSRDTNFDWVWDSKSCSAACFLGDDAREVIFHHDYSCGTAGVRGTNPMQDDQYFWEVKMVSPVYGTDMMIGVGTIHMDLNKYRHSFCSLLGIDEESWGLSYLGQIYHSGNRERYTEKFGQGTIIGLHLNMWNGTLSFYKNRRPLGVAYRGLKGKTLYPMVSSTAARSSMKVISCRSVCTSLQFMCCQVLRECVPSHLSVLDSVELPPGLKLFLENNLGWLLQSVAPPPRPKPSTSSRGRKRARSVEKGNKTCNKVVRLQ